MTMHLFVTAILWFGILCAGLFLAACAVGICLWGNAKFNRRGKV